MPLSLSHPSLLSLLWWRQIVSKSKVELKPCCPICGILGKAQVFKELVGYHVLLLYKAVDWEAFGMESLSHGANQHLGIAFPSMLWQRVQHPHGTVIIHQNPGQRLTLIIIDAAGREVADKVLNGLVTLCVAAKFPGFIHQIDMREVERWNPWLKLTVGTENKQSLVSEEKTIRLFCLLWIQAKWDEMPCRYLSTAGVSRWLLSGK